MLRSNPDTFAAATQAIKDEPNINYAIITLVDFCERETKMSMRITAVVCLVAGMLLGFMIGANT